MRRWWIGLTGVGGGLLGAASSLWSHQWDATFWALIATGWALVCWLEL